MPTEVPEEQPKKYRFFVYIVESPSAPDLYPGRSEGGLVAQAIGLDSIPSVVRTAINSEAFGAALVMGLPEAMKQYPGLYPILHLSAHGGSEGVQLSSGETVTWTQLRDYLVPVNASLQGGLLLCMSACEGYGACRMAMGIGDAQHPYIAMIGNYGKPTWSDTAVSYLAFYHLLAKGYDIRDAVTAMKAASADLRWVLETADEIRQGFIDFVKKKDVPAGAQRELEAVGRDASLSPDAKALEAAKRG